MPADLFVASLILLLAAGATFAWSTKAHGGNAPRDPGAAPKQSVPRSAPNGARNAAVLDGFDEIATLDAVHFGLTEVPDGTTFIWRRANGRLSARLRPTSSYKDADGHVCRHLVLTLSSLGYQRTARGVACRQADGGWSLSN